MEGPRHLRLVVISSAARNPRAMMIYNQKWIIYSLKQRVRRFTKKKMFR